MGTDPAVTDKEIDILILKALDEKSGIPREGVHKNRGKNKKKFNCFTGLTFVDLR